MFDIRREDGTPVVAHLLSLTPFRRIVKDYFMICDSYYQAIRTATPDRIEAIDMGRRGIHDEGSRTLQERLKGKVRVDFETARRLFTLISVLHWKEDTECAQLATPPRARVLRRPYCSRAARMPCARRWRKACCSRCFPRRCM